MTRLTLGLIAAAVVSAVSAMVLGLLLLLEARRMAPKVRERVAEVPHWLSSHTPEVLPARRIIADLDAVKDDMHRVRELLEERPRERQRTS